MLLIHVFILEPFNSIMNLFLFVPVILVLRLSSIVVLNITVVPLYLGSPVNRAWSYVVFFAESLLMNEFYHEINFLVKRT